MRIVGAKKEKETRLTHGAVVFEGFGNLSASQVSEVGHRGRSRELQVGLLGHNPGTDNKHRLDTLKWHAPVPNYLLVLRVV